MAPYGTRNVEIKRPHSTLLRSNFHLHINEASRIMAPGCTQIETQSHRRVIKTPKLTPCCVVFIFCTSITNWRYVQRKRSALKMWKIEAGSDFFFSCSYRCVCVCVCFATDMFAMREVGAQWEKERHREPFLCASAVYTWPLTVQTDVRIKIQCGQGHQPQ